MEPVTSILGCKTNLRKREISENMIVFPGVSPPDKTAPKQNMYNHCTPTPSLHLAPTHEYPVCSAIREFP